MLTGFWQKSRMFTLRYAGLSFYWAWVFLSFNSAQLTGNGESHEVLSLVHLVSSIAAVVTFLVALCFYRAIASWSSKRTSQVLVVLSLLAGFGTLLYTFPVFSSTVSFAVFGAALSGLTCSAIVLAWGVVYRDLGARDAVLFTSGSFLGAAALYFAVSLLGGVVSALVVSFFPLAAAVCAATSLALQRGEGAVVSFCGGPVGHKRTNASEQGRGSQERAQKPLSADSCFAASKGSQGSSVKPNRGSSRGSELKQLLQTALSWRVILGLMAALFAYGGLRVYFGDIAPAVYGNPALMTLPLILASAIFFVYGIFVSKTSLNLGVLYRIAMPLFALAFILIALFGGDNAAAVFSMVSTGSVLFEVLTWVLLVEIARTTHFPALLVFAVGRLVVHLAIVAGELTAFALISDVLVFALIAICILLVSAGFTFTDRDTTFLFEPPTPNELANIAQVAPRITTADEQVLMMHHLQARIDAVADTDGLSPREREVFALWVTGHGSKYIQDKFVISAATVKTHVRHIYEKCDVHNRAELMRELETAGE